MRVINRYKSTLVAFLGAFQLEAFQGATQKILTLLMVYGFTVTFSQKTFADTGGVQEVSGVKFNVIQEFKGQKLQLVGAGLRERFFLDLYVIGLYSPTGAVPNLDDVDEMIALRLQILSKAVTPKRMIEATESGFKRVLKKPNPAIDQDIQRLITAFKDNIVPGDVFELVYSPTVGVEVLKNSEATIDPIKTPGFKQALFGIWLFSDTEDKSLRKALLAYQ